MLRDFSIRNQYIISFLSDAKQLSLLKLGRLSAKGAAINSCQMIIPNRSHYHWQWEEFPRIRVKLKSLILLGLDLDDDLLSGDAVFERTRSFSLRGMH